ncbi:4'-phosphopantetheinyl transferase family protein [Arenimonas fontis]|uniref:4'-phosphopantetheinyl transferase superfamily protein n=1 Tax=Arenimonas fontis TaxID=2608255 RepID=A0A5B2ZD08_9GAMM|nr:4'-phosphopantetheinyl transferase superfamily protein [Arenimonas fontis]KAA2285959.1 4'-phosphopantetheinyl transferase superfamily protein [Arenimonas fontis]
MLRCLLRVAEAIPPSGTAADWLSEAERARLAAMRAPRRRDQYLAGHWLARSLAARGFGGHAGDWHWQHPEGEPPRLTRSGWREPLRVSISHSGERIAVAVANGPVGLDLEYPQRPRDLDGLAAFVFTRGERERLAAQPAPERARAFYRYWALKEAEGKRCGKGLLPGRARRLQCEPAAAEQAEALTWQLPDGGMLAIAAWPGIVAVIGEQDWGAPTGWRLVEV